MITHIVALAAVFAFQAEPKLPEEKDTNQATQVAPAPTAPVAIAPADAPVAAAASAPSEAAPDGFGYDAFRSAAGAIVSGPVDEEYLLSPGDEVVISIWGAMNETMNLKVSDDGFLELPEGGGRIQTNAIALKDLQGLVVRALSQIYAAYINAGDPSKSSAFVDVRLGKIHPMLVYIVGEVEKPGAYGMSATVANVINALTNAGGVRPTGTLRDVKIRRKDGSVDSVDLYKFVLSGEIDFRKIRVQPGDYIFVPLKAKSVRVTGAVRRPMAYELIGDEGVRELLALAGGTTPEAYLKQVQLRRTIPNVGESVLDVDLDALLMTKNGNMALNDRDILTIGDSVQVRRPVVSISGDGIKRAGTYEWRPGMRLSDLISKGEGLREHAFLERADLIRTEDDFSKRLQIFSLTGLYEKAVTGGFVRSASSDGDFDLREMDAVLVQSSWGLAGNDKSVTLAGHVKEPGAAVLAQGMTLYDILFTRGGFQDPDFAKAAYMDLAHVRRQIPGAVRTKTIAFDLGALLRKEPTANMPLEDGDVVQIHTYEDLTGSPTVVVDGLVRKGGVFEYSEGLSLEDLIVMAGGLVSQAVRPEALIARTLGSGGSDAPPVVVVALDGGRGAERARTPLMPDDRITIRHQKGWEPKAVGTIRGEVFYPGTYTLGREGARLTDLVRLCGGLKREAFPAGAVLFRVADRSGAALSSAMTIDLDAALADQASEANLELLDGDELLIPKNAGTVEVRGAVKRPIATQFRAAMTLDDYLALCGGLLEKGDRSRVTVQAPNRATRLVGADENPTLMPGSVVDVPLQRESERMRTVEVKGSVAKPAIVQYTDDAPLGYYIALCGGFTANADLDKVAIITPDGAMLTGPKGEPFNPFVPAGSIVVVTARPTTEAK